MEINGLKLPAAFVQDVQSKRFHREVGVWELRKNFNAFNEPLETEIDQVFEDIASIQQQTAKMAQGYTSVSEEDINVASDQYNAQPGEMLYFWDFSRIVCFAIAADGAPFCFDFRENQQEPEVIWWADAFWQRVTPDYETFVQLFAISTRST